MNDDHDFEQAAREFLDEGPDRTPAATIDAVLLAVRTTPQERDLRIPWRTSPMSNPMRLVAAIAVIVVAGVAAFNLLGPSPDVGGVGAGGEPSASPSPAPTSTPTPTAAASAAVPVPEGPLAAGTYRMPQVFGGCGQPPIPGCSPSPAHDAVRLTFTVPGGWDGVGTGAIWLTDKGMGAPDGAGLLVGRGAAWLLTDPCTKAQPVVAADIAVGPSVDDFANALADHPLLDVTDPVDVTLAGFSGKYVDLQVPADISMCETYLPWDTGIYAQGPSERWHLWILDVDGLRFVVQSTDYAGTSAKHRSELAAIVDSIKIEP